MKELDFFANIGLKTRIQLIFTNITRIFANSQITPIITDGTPIAHLMAHQMTHGLHADN